MPKNKAVAETSDGDVQAPKRKRGPKPRHGVAMDDATRSRAARERREARRAGNTRALAEALRDLWGDRTDPAAPEVLAALGEALVGYALDLHTGPGDDMAGADAAIRAAVQSLHAALTDHLGGAPEAGDGAIRQALDELQIEQEQHR